MSNDTLVLSLIGGSLIAGSAYMYMTAKKDDSAIPEEVRDGPEAWLPGTNAKYIPRDNVLLNALDSLAAYRHVDKIQFNKIINEIEQFYEFYVSVMANKLGRENPCIVSYGAQYLLNIKTHMLVLKRTVMEKYPQHQRDLLDRRLDNRMNQVETTCNSYYLNFIKEAKCKKL